MIIHLNIALEITINHLTDWRRPIYTHNQQATTKPHTVSKTLTRKSHNLDLPPLLDKPLLQQLDLRRLPATIQPLEHHERAPHLCPAPGVVGDCGLVLARRA